MNAMEPVRTAIVGLGWWGRKMTDLVAGGDAGLVFVRAVDPSPDAAEFAASRDLPLSADLADALADPAVEAVVLATPHGLHEAQIAAAVKAGKHVFCEKPLALTKAGAETAVALCRDAGLVLGMGHERRYEPPIAAILEGRRIRPARPSPSDRGEFQPRQVPGARPVELAAQCHRGAGRRHDGDRHPSHRPLRQADGAGARRSRRLREARLRDRPGRHDERPYPLRRRRHRLCRGDARDPLHLALRGLRHQGVGRGPRQGPCRGAGRLDRHPRRRRRARSPSPRSARPSRSATTSPPSPAAVRGEAPYPITGDDLIANIALLEAIIRSAATGAVEVVS